MEKKKILVKGYSLKPPKNSCNMVEAELTRPAEQMNKPSAGMSEWPNQ